MQTVVGFTIKGDATSAVNAASAADKALSVLRQTIGGSTAPVAALARANEALAISEQKAAAGANAMATAQGRAANAAGALNQTNGQTRAGFQNLGFQINDVTTQLASGTRGSVIFAQQSGQILGALQLIAGGAENSHTKFGRLAGFLGGPWGIAITLAVSAVGLFASSLFDAEQSSDATGSATDRLVNKLDIGKNSYTSLIDVVNEYNAAQSNSTAKTYDAIIAAEKMAEANLKAAEAQLKVYQAATLQGPTGLNGQGQFAASVVAGRLEGRITQLRKELAAANLASSNERVKTKTDPRYALETAHKSKMIDLEAVYNVRLKAGNITQKERNDYEQKRAGMINAQTAALKNFDEKAKKSGQTRKTKTADVNYNASEIGSQALLDTARQYLGRSENVGKDNGVLKSLFSQANINIDPNKTAWCAAFVNAVLAVNGLPGNGKLNAKSFLTYGSETKDPKKGDIAVFKDLNGNNAAEGHVGFFQGYDKNGNIRVLGGNQGRNGAVTETTIDKKKLLAFRSAPSAGQAAEAAEADFKQLEEFGKRASAAIGDINARYSEQPRLIAEAASVTADLDAIIKDLSERKPPGFETAIAEAERLKAALPAQILAEPFVRMQAEAAKYAQTQMLILSGREDEVRALEMIEEIERELGPISAERKQEIYDIVAAEEKISDLLDKREAILGAYSASIGDLRGALTDLLSGGNIKDFGKSLKSNLKKLRGELLTEQLFGQPLRDLEKLTRSRTGVDAQIDVFKTQIDATGKNTKTLAENIEADGKKVTDALAGVAAKIIGGEAISGSSQSAFDVSMSRTLESLAEAITNEGGNDIVVAGERAGLRERQKGEELGSMTPSDYFGQVSSHLVDPLLAKLDAVLGTNFFAKLSLVFRGVAEGYAAAGHVGAVIGGAQGFARQLAESGILKNQAFAAINEVLGTAAGGATTGFKVAQVGRAFGIGTSSTGGSIGGAVGALTGIPGGDLIGSIIGSIVGGLFKKKPRGAAIITSADNPATITGNKAEVREGLGTISGSLQEQLRQVADVLGGELGEFRVSIGQYKDYYRVSASGSANVGDKKFPRGAGADLIYDGKDPEAALRAALANALSDGGVSGISAAMQKALASDTNLERAIKEALKVRDVEDILGGIGGALTRQFKAFETQAKERVRIASQYGFDVIKIEQYNAEERVKLVDGILTERVGSLQNLLKDLKFGDLFEGTASERRLTLLAEIDKAKAGAQAGTAGAADRLADLTRQLVESSREAYGTAGPEYAGDRANAISTAETIIAAENERIRAAQQAALDTATATIDTARLTNEGNNILSEIAAGIRDVRGLLSTPTGTPPPARPGILNGGFGARNVGL